MCVRIYIYCLIYIDEAAALENRLPIFLDLVYSLQPSEQLIPMFLHVLCTRQQLAPYLNLVFNQVIKAVEP